MKDLEQYFESIFPPAKWCGVRTIVAVSGGPDSVAALRAMLAIGRKTENWTAADLIVGHVNHGTRGEESDADSRFVQHLANESGLPFYEPALPTESAPGSSEESLRNFRYHQLLELATKLGARYIVTGHNFDDQVETILFRIIRGTGISGLAGIPRQRLANESVTIIRPLLDLRRDQIVEYLNEIGQDFRMDSSNADSKYARNYLRNELLPKLKSRFGNSVSDSIARLGSQSGDVNEYLDGETEGLDDAVIEQTQNHLELDCDPLNRCSPVLIRHWLNRIWVDQNWPRQSMTFQWWQRICDTIQSSNAPGADTKGGDKKCISKSLDLPGGVRMDRINGRVRFTMIRH